MLRIIMIGLTGLAIAACTETPSGDPLSEASINEVKQAATSLYGDNINFTQLFQSDLAICGKLVKAGKEQRFIYVRQRFLLEERSPSGEWEAQWFSICEP